MPGPCSMPSGPKDEWLKQNKIVCNLHMTSKSNRICSPSSPVVGARKEALTHDFVTYRVWLLRRNRLRTGKTS